MTAPIIQQTLNHINFQLKEEVDLSFLSDLGEAFCVFDQNNSGNISFGLKNKAGKNPSFALNAMLNYLRAFFSSSPIRSPSVKPFSSSGMLAL